jgi:DNA-3-methyladenine glycosylase
MWGDGGLAYVYFTYGMHFCLNVVAERPGEPSACLIRALEPLEGLATMYQHRSRKPRKAELRVADLCSGPARLTQALAVGRSLDGTDLTSSPELYLIRGTRIPPERIAASPRIGVSYAKEWAAKPLRFFLTDHPHVSRG